MKQNDYLKNKEIKLPAGKLGMGPRAGLAIQRSDVEVPAKTPKQYSLKSPLQSDADLWCTAAGSWPSLSHSNHRTQCWINPHRLIRRPGVTSVPHGNNWMCRGRVNKIFHKRKKLFGETKGAKDGET